MYQLSVGRFTVSSIQDYANEGTIAFLAPNADPRELAEAMARFGVTGEMIEISYNPILIETGHEKILIDAGWGQWLETGDGGTYHGKLQDTMSVEDIDLVVLTHAHADHYGGLVAENGDLIFPNARYAMWQSEWNDWASDEAIQRLEEEQNPRAELMRHFLRPLQTQMRFLTEANPEIAPGITAIYAPGHTMGHIAIHIADGNDAMIIASDAVVHPVHIERLDWHFGNEADTRAARTTRERLLSMACEQNALFHAYHFTHPGIGHITRTDNGYRFNPI